MKDPHGAEGRRRNSKAFRQSLDTYITHATRIGGRRHRRTATRPTVRAAATRPETRDVREWALANGDEISTRRPHPPDIEQAYREAS